MIGLCISTLEINTRMKIKDLKPGYEMSSVPEGRTCNENETKSVAKVAKILKGPFSKTDDKDNTLNVHKQVEEAESTSAIMRRRRRVTSVLTKRLTRDITHIFVCTNGKNVDGMRAGKLNILLS